MVSIDSRPLCLPRYLTPRSDLPTYGDKARAVAKVLGVPLMPWQELLFDLALEHDPATKRFRFREVVFSVPRQSGKTTAVLVQKLLRATFFADLFGRPQRMAYSAQTGGDARAKMLEDEWPLIEASPFIAVCKDPIKANGREAFIFKNGSRVDVLSSMESAGHGKILDNPFVDEAFTDQDDRREQSMIPAMSTRKEAQLWVCSTMGDDKSLYFNRKVDTCRELSLRGDSEVCYIEYSAPDDAHPDDMELAYTYMPALGHTIDERAVKHARETMSEGEYRRAYMNQRTQSSERIIPAVIWEAVQKPVQPDGKVVFSLSIPEDRDAASIACADFEGRVELVDHARGTQWVLGRCEELARKYHAAIALDPSAPEGAFQEELESRRIKIIPVSGRDYAKACGHFYDAVANQKISIYPDERLNLAVGAAAKRYTGDTYVWARKGGDISPLVAVTQAFWAASQPQAPSKYWSAEDLYG